MTYVYILYVTPKLNHRSLSGPLQWCQASKALCRGFLLRARLRGRNGFGSGSVHGGSLISHHHAPQHDFCSAHTHTQSATPAIRKISHRSGNNFACRKRQPRLPLKPMNNVKSHPPSYGPYLFTIESLSHSKMLFFSEFSVLLYYILQPKYTAII